MQDLNFNSFVVEMKCNLSRVDAMDSMWNKI
jgi:hypothetical protein